MTSLLYIFSNRADSQAICARLYELLSKSFSAEITEHDPVASRMEKLRAAFEGRTTSIPEVVLKSEERLAARAGKGFLIICKYCLGDIFVKVCESCIQVTSPIDVDADSQSTIRSILTAVADGKFE